MAAGLAARFGSDKLLASWRGRPLYEHLFAALPASDFARTVVVSVHPEILAAGAARGFVPVMNRHPEKGPGRTVRLGLRRLTDMDACLFAVCDQPELQRSSLRRMLCSYRDGILAAAFGGRRGNPVLFPSSLFPQLLHLPDAQGGSAVIRANREILSLHEVGCRRELADVDTTAQLQALANLRYLLIDGPQAEKLLLSAEQLLPDGIRSRLRNLPDGPAARPLGSLPAETARRLLSLPETLLLTEGDCGPEEVAQRMREISTALEAGGPAQSSVCV